MTDHEFNRRMVRTVLTVAGVAVLLAAMWAARDALMIVYVSALIAMGFSPLVRLIERPATRKRRRAMPRALAIFAIYLTIIGVFIVIGLLVIPPLIEQGNALWERLPQLFGDVQGALVRHGLQVRTVTLQEAVQNAPAGSGGNAMSTAWAAISSLVGGAFGVIVIIVLSFYLLIEGASVMTYATRFITPDQRAHVTAAAREAVDKVSAWLRAQLLLAAVMGTLAAVGLGLLRIPYFYVVALVAAAGETIPMVGPVVAGITAVGIALSVSPKLAVTVGVLFLLFHQLEANILVPKIMERRVGVSPVAVMVGLLIGGSVFGLVGAILAVPTTALLSVLVEELSSSK